MALTQGSKILASDINSNNLLPVNITDSSQHYTITGNLSLYSPVYIRGGTVSLLKDNTHTGLYITYENYPYFSGDGTYEPYLLISHASNSSGLIFMLNRKQFYNNWNEQYSNDYSESRTTDIKEPGYCVATGPDAIMHLTTERLQPNCGIISDTTAMNIGKEGDTPIAVMGRVLAYPFQPRENYPLGAAVCSGPNGTVDLMTREEIMQYPDRLVGTVSEIPDEKQWETEYSDSDIKLNGRIWIYVK